MSEKQRTRKAKITFETRETTFEVVFLMSYVSISACGTVFEVWGMPLPIKGKSVRVSDGEIISAEQGNDDFNK